MLDAAIGTELKSRTIAKAMVGVRRIAPNRARMPSSARRRSPERRALTMLIGGAASAWPLAARAQQPGHAKADRDFPPGRPDHALPDRNRRGQRVARVFRRAAAPRLRRRRQSADRTLFRRGASRRYAILAREIVARNPDVIVTGTNPVVTAFKAATGTIPIVAFCMLDPLHAGLVTSLGRPGGNLTGITLDPGVDIWGKRLEILKEAIPSTARAVFLGMREGGKARRAGSAGRRRAVGEFRWSLSCRTRAMPRRSSASSRRSSSSGRTPCWSAGKATSTPTASWIAELAGQKRLPTMCPYRDYVEAGALMSYAVDLAELLTHGR